MSRFLIALSLILALVPHPSRPIHAQPASDDNALSLSEQNLRDFDFMVDKIATNYAGWHSKVTTQTRSDFDSHTARIRDQVAAASPGDLASLYREWMRFFDDKHMGVIDNIAGRREENATKVERVDWTETNIRNRLSAVTDPDPLEGIWAIDASYKIGISQSDDQPGVYLAAVLETTSPNWQPGEIKAKLQKAQDGSIAVTYFSGSRKPFDLQGKLFASNTALQLSRFGSWTKLWPERADADQVSRESASPAMFLQPLSEQTLWLRLPDFTDRRAEPLRKLFDENRELLKNTPNLVIDLRENGGGSDYVYEPVIDLIYTQPIIAIGMELRSTEDNIAIREGQRDLAIKGFPDAVPGLTEQIDAMKEHPGHYVALGQRQFDFILREAVLEKPERIAILIDDAGSSGEEFLLAARQSRKSVLFGQHNSKGVLDFSNVIDMPTPSGRHRFGWPISRSLRLPDYPVDPEGIAPDVRIPADITDPIAFVLDWLEN